MALLLIILTFLAMALMLIYVFVREQRRDSRQVPWVHSVSQGLMHLAAVAVGAFLLADFVGFLDNFGRSSVPNREFTLGCLIAGFVVAMVAAHVMACSRPEEIDADTSKTKSAFVFPLVAFGIMIVLWGLIGVLDFLSGIGGGSAM